MTKQRLRGGRPARREDELQPQSPSLCEHSTRGRKTGMANHSMQEETPGCLSKTPHVLRGCEQ